MTERWRQIEPGSIHEVSDQGRVRSLMGPRHRVGLRRTCLNKAGYPMITLKIGDRCKTCYVHDLVLTAFVGPRPARHEARHLNGLKADNHLENLAWGTRAENQHDRVVHGTSNRGARNGRALLTLEAVAAIRAATGSRGLHAQLARQHGVSRPTIAGIRANRHWRD